MTKSKTLNNYFAKKLQRSWIERIRLELEKIEKEISKDFVLQFLKYKKWLLELISEPSNASTIDDPRVAWAIERWNKKIAEVFSSDYTRKRIRQEVMAVTI